MHQKRRNLPESFGGDYMIKLSEDQRKDILLAYKLDNSRQNIEKLSKDYNISKRRIFQIAKEDASEDIEKAITESKDNFTKRANEIIKLLLDKIEEKALNDDKITLSQLSTTLGILYDKSRLENNLSTSNSSININIKVEK